MGLINSDDIANVRDRARLDDVVGTVVTLRSAGGGNYKGLCPFHDEKSPSFHVTPSKGLWHCFGCQEGGDVIDFVRKIDGLTFVEAVEQLAGRFNVPLRYEDNADRPTAPSDYAVKKRLSLVNGYAAERFHTLLLALPEDHPARAFLGERGFTVDHLVDAQVGFAPAGGRDLIDWLSRVHQIPVADVVAAGLAVEGSRGTYDRFRGRLMWPIRDAAGTVVGFGGRKLFDDDQGPKYLNTPETVLYKKSHILYGLDVARKRVASEGRVVIVEGYTDVMACRAAGIRTAVATCGTAFGADHVALLRRVVGDDGAFGGDIIFMFDGDQAGRKAAVRSFDLDSKFTNHTFVAVEPSGQDPCEVRLARGDDGLRALIDSRVPLFEFVLTLTLNQHDLATPEGRAVALEQVAPILTQIRDVDVRHGYERKLAEQLGISESRVGAAARVTGAKRNVDGNSPAVPEYGTSEWLEREALKCVIQFPWAAPDWYFPLVEETAYLNRDHLAVHKIVHKKLGQTPDNSVFSDEQTRVWLGSLLDEAGEDDQVRSLIADLSLAPTPTDDNVEQIELYVVRTYANLVDEAASRVEEDTRSKIAAVNLGDAEYDRLLDAYQTIKDYRRSLKKERQEYESSLSL